MSKKYKVGGSDVKKMTIDDKEEVMLSACGVVKFAYLAWRDDKKPNGKVLVRRFYEYISARGYNSTAVDLTM